MHDKRRGSSVVHVGALIHDSRADLALHRGRQSFDLTTKANGNGMQIGVIGLGRMGGNISRRLMKAGHDRVVYDDAEARRRARPRWRETAGCHTPTTRSLADLVQGSLGDRPARRLE